MVTGKLGPAGKGPSTVLDFGAWLSGALAVYTLGQVCGTGVNSQLTNY